MSTQKRAAVALLRHTTKVSQLLVEYLEMEDRQLMNEANTHDLLRRLSDRVGAMQHEMMLLASQ